MKYNKYIIKLYNNITNIISTYYNERNEMN